MKQLTTTTATYSKVTITVSSDRIGGNTMFCCENSLSGRHTQDKWFATHGEAISNEKLEIDRKMGIVHPVEERRNRWRR
jgi:hypothetical protein